MGEAVRKMWAGAYKAVHRVGGVPEITVEALHAKLEAKEPLCILDVREPWEVERCKLAGSVVIPLGQLHARLGELDAHKDTPVVVHCKFGGRSARAVQLMQRAGFSNVMNLTGGIDAWAERVDPSLPRY